MLWMYTYTLLNWNRYGLQFYWVNSLRSLRSYRFSRFCCSLSHALFDTICTFYMQNTFYISQGKVVSTGSRNSPGYSFRLESFRFSSRLYASQVVPVIGPLFVVGVLFPRDCSVIADQTHSSIRLETVCFILSTVSSNEIL